MATATIKSSLDIIPFYGYWFNIKFYELPIFDRNVKLYGTYLVMQTLNKPQLIVT